MDPTGPEYGPDCVLYSMLDNFKTPICKHTHSHRARFGHSRGSVWPQGLSNVNLTVAVAITNYRPRICGHTHLALATQLRVEVHACVQPHTPNTHANTHTHNLTRTRTHPPHTTFAPVYIQCHSPTASPTHAEEPIIPNHLCKHRRHSDTTNRHCKQHRATLTPQRNIHQ
jgi:hypothetical protein